MIQEFEEQSVYPKYFRLWTYLPHGGQVVSAMSLPKWDMDR